MRINNCWKKVWLSLVVTLLMLNLSGCRKNIPGYGYDVLKYSQIRASVRITSPEKIVSSVALITIDRSNHLRIDLQDAFGLTRMVIHADKKRIEFADIGNRCKSGYSGWISRIALASGVDVWFNQLIDRVFPEIWPDRPQTYRTARNGRFRFDISIHPSGSDSNGHTVIRVPDRNVEISVFWLDSYPVDLFDDERFFSDWPECMEHDYLKKVFQI